MTQAAGVHHALLENRERLSLSGVTEIGSFDDRTVILYTQMGELTVIGRGLQIEQLSVETGDVRGTGEIRALQYGDRDRRAPLTLRGRLLR